jgi:hypothetical protein
MKSIAQHISNIRSLIKVYGRNPEGYTDEGLYSLFSVSRAEILSNKLKKFDAIHEDNWFQICIGLEIAKSHNCDCVPDNLECKILKSKYKLPAVLVGSNMSKLKVRLISGKVVNIVPEDEWFRRSKKETQEYFGSIVNSYLILWNVPLVLKAILIVGIWSDITQLGTIPNCSDDGTEHGACFNPMDMEYPLQDEYARPAYKMVMELLNIPLQLPQDQTNDSNEFIKL